MIYFELILNLFLTALIYFTSIAKVKKSINVKPPTLIQPKSSAEFLFQLNLIISQTEKSITLTKTRISVMNILIFSKLFSKGLQIQIQQENAPDIQAVIKLQAARSSQNTTKLIMNKVFLMSNRVKYYLVPYLQLLLIPSTKTDNFFGTVPLFAKQEKKTAIKNRFPYSVINAIKEMVLFKVVSVLQLAIYNIDAKVISQKLEVKILINPEQIKY
ncbi:unnamed protein product [Paramecium octaurelia]|uniref:Uncharacterized protein n=1 Tax=Paramecium octaurelia TaxID=43137 RepID=A0A8S1X2N2_PAROT|nr:unnamed protein product [Paramecium octaurelia]